jgi:ribonuclease P protein component
MTGAPRNTFSKAEKLKSRKQIDGLFQEGKSFFAAPVKCYYRLESLQVDRLESLQVDKLESLQVDKLESLQVDRLESFENTIEHTAQTQTVKHAHSHNSPLGGAKGPQTINVKCGVSVSKRNFKKAVDRNRIKRLLREAYRLHKAPLLEKLNHRQQQLELFFVFTDKTLPTFALVEEKMKYCMRRLGKIVEGGS